MEDYGSFKVVYFPPILLCCIHSSSLYVNCTYIKWLKKKKKGVPAWVAQSVEHHTPDFLSGHDLRVVRYSPALSSSLGMEPA